MYQTTQNEVCHNVPQQPQQSVTQLSNHALTLRLINAAQDRDYVAVVVAQDELLARLGSPFGSEVQEAVCGNRHPQGPVCQRTPDHDGIHYQDASMGWHHA